MARIVMGTLTQPDSSGMAQGRLSLTDMVERALACHRAGDLGEAERLYRAILAENPVHGEALYYLGLILHRRGHSDAALALIDQSLAAGAVRAEVYGNRGLILQARRRYTEALASYEHALALKPNQAEGHYHRANALKDLGRFDDALAGYDRAVALRPDLAEAYNNRGLVLYLLRRYEAALASFDRALALRPELADAHNNRGNVLCALRRFEEALAAYDRAVALQVDVAETHNNRSLVLHLLQRFDEALASCERALALRPDFAQALNIRGKTLHELRRCNDALASLDRALALSPDDAEAHANRGLVMQALQRFPEALASYERAVALRPDYAEAHWNEALCRLLRGDFARGWPKYEWRWQTDQFAPAQRNFSAPLWLGKEKLAGKTILLHAEQGFGDAIQFCRYVPLVAAAGATIILEVQTGLVSLLRDLAGSGQIRAQGEELPGFDYHCPLLSLPLAFQTDLATIPSAVPYLSAYPDQAAFWRRRLEPFPGLHVGLVWGGNPRLSQPQASAIDRRRSIALDRLAPLVGIPGVTFLSLQKGEPATQLQGSAFAPVMLDWMGEMNDFADTAGLIETLDLVISVDTAVAHLAGALGKPVWLLNRFDTCWRWLLDRNDSPWYPTLRQFRQPRPDDWEAVIARVAVELAQLAGSTEAVRDHGLTLVRS